MTVSMKNKVSTNTNEVGVCYEGSDATHTYYISNIEFEKYEDIYAFQLALNRTNFGHGEFMVDAELSDYCRITYTSSGLYDEVNTDFAIDLEDKLKMFFE